MKTLVSLFQGAMTVTEESGIVSLNFSESIGGGDAAGIITGSGHVSLNAQQGLALAEALLNSHLPASLSPLAQVVEGIVNQALKSAE